MSEWKEYKWGDLASLEYGKGLQDYLRDDGKYPVFGIKGKIGTTDSFLCPYPSIIIGRKGAYSDFRNTAILSMTGTWGRQRVQTAVLKDYEIKYSKDAMEGFHSFCHPHFLKMKQNQIQIHTLTRLRDTLLPKLMSGEVRVKKDDTTNGGGK